MKQIQPWSGEVITHFTPTRMKATLSDMLSGLKEHWRELREGEPGKRFQERYKRNKQEQKSRPWYRRLAMPLLAGLLIAGGAVLLVIPGPGIPLIIIGLSLLAGQSMAIARFMDGAELKLRKVFQAAKKMWRQARRKARHA